MVPLTPEYLMLRSDITIEQKMTRDYFTILQEEFNTISLERPGIIRLNFLKPEIILSEDTLELQSNYTDYEKVDFKPYINTRLVIQFLYEINTFYIAIGNNAIIAINGILYIPNDIFIKKIYNLLNCFNLYGIQIDMENVYSPVSQR